MAPDSCRHTDPMTGVVAEVGTDGVPVGLAPPPPPPPPPRGGGARATAPPPPAPGGHARDLLERLAADDWDERDWDEMDPDDEPGGSVR